MRALLSLLLVIAIIFAGYYFFLREAATADGEGNPTALITTSGVENDLLAIAQAQRVYITQHDSYGSFDQLIESGALQMDTRGRDGYTYTVEAGVGGFIVTAKREVGRGVPQPTLVIDQNMEIRRLP